MLDQSDQQLEWRSSRRPFFGRGNGAFDPTTTTGQTQACIKTSTENTVAPSWLRACRVETHTVTETEEEHFNVVTTLETES